MANKDFILYCLFFVFYISIDCEMIYFILYKTFLKRELSDYVSKIGVKFLNLNHYTIFIQGSLTMCFNNKYNVSNS